MLSVHMCILSLDVGVFKYQVVHYENQIGPSNCCLTLIKSISKSMNNLSSRFYFYLQYMYGYNILSQLEMKLLICLG